MAGARRVVFQFAAQPSQVKPQIVGALLEAAAPDPRQDLSPPDQLTRAAQQDLQEPPLGGSEPECLPLPGLVRIRSTNLVRGEIDQPLADHSLARLVLAGLAFVAAQYGPQPGQQF